jgi:hypothetical protein
VIAGIGIVLLASTILYLTAHLNSRRDPANGLSRWRNRNACARRRRSLSNLLSHHSRRACLGRTIPV